MKSFKNYLLEMYPMPPAVETQQVYKMEAPKNAPNIGGAGQIRAQVKVETGPAPQSTVTFGQEKKPSSGPGYDREAIKKRIRSDESAGNMDKILRRYNDNRGLPTIGHGHFIDMKLSPGIFKQVLGKDDAAVADILGGKSALTMQEAELIFDYDVDQRMKQVTKAIPNFNSFSPNLQADVASEWFRGMMGKSKNTINLLNQGKFQEAAREFLDADDYRRAVKEKSGVKTRMERVAKSIADEAKRKKS